MVSNCRRLTPVSAALRSKQYCYSPLNGTPVHPPPHTHTLSLWHDTHVSHLRERTSIFVLSHWKLQSTSLFNSSHLWLRISCRGSSWSFLKLYLPLDNNRGWPEILANRTCLPWMSVVSFVPSSVQKKEKQSNFPASDSHLTILGRSLLSYRYFDRHAIFLPVAWQPE